jgi:1,4-alpha-glucan branching enzyme
MPSGYLALLLHAHLPFVRHPEHDRFLEEDWLYEAVVETYLPLLEVMDGWTRDEVPWRLTLSLTPPLCAMLSDDLLRERCAAHLTRLSELCDREVERTHFDSHLHSLALHYRDRLDQALATWGRAGGDLVAAFAAHQERGHLEIITCAATHGYLPLMAHQPRAVWAQVKVAVDDYARHFGRPPRGVWLPECGYFPGLDLVLRDAGLRYFVTDAHGLLLAEPRPRYGNFAPLFCPRSGVAAFGRDLESSVQVWSRDRGYPGDPAYREFYRDIGYDLPFDYVAPYVQATGERKNTGIKYHRITGAVDLGDKQLYDPYWARARAAEHARAFLASRERQMAWLEAAMGRPPLVVSPYDAELFGHWWYEGPWWLDLVVRECATEAGAVPLTHLAEYLEGHPTQQVSEPAQSSWGDHGYHEYWLNDTNSWIYPHLDRAAERLTALARAHRAATGIVARALDQAARELLLAQSSDWAFIMRAGTMVDYAASRTRSHLRRLRALCDQVEAGAVDEAWLARLEATDTIFPGIDFRVYA